MTGLPDEAFLAKMRDLEAAYLQHEDPIRRSGFGGGRERWEAERRPLTQAIDGDGSFLDVGCANGWLAKCVTDWTSEFGLVIEPFGVDLGGTLIADAKRLLKDAWAADAWSWVPPRRFTYVYSLLDLAPEHLRLDWIRRLSAWVEPAGRVIVASYGSKSRGIEPEVVSRAVADAGFVVVGEAAGGTGPITRFAWAQR